MPPMASPLTTMAKFATGDSTLAVRIHSFASAAV